MNHSHWYGIPPQGCDVPHWIPYLEAELIGMEPDRKITIPLPQPKAPARPPVNARPAPRTASAEWGQVAHVHVCNTCATPFTFPPFGVPHACPTCARRLRIQGTAS